MRSSSSFGRAYFTLDKDELVYTTDYFDGVLRSWRIPEVGGRFKLVLAGRLVLDLDRSTARFYHLLTHETEPT